MRFGALPNGRTLFIKDFGHVGIPRVIYEGNLNEEFVENIKNNKFNLSEGVICKGVTLTKKGRPALYYCKIKTNDWFERLRTKDVYLYERELKDSKMGCLSV